MRTLSGAVLDGLGGGRTLATKPIIDAKDMTRRKQRIMDQRWDMAIRLGKVPHLAEMANKFDRSTYGVNGISIFSPFCPERSLPNPTIFVPPDEITDDEVELYQMTEEDMEMLTRLIAMEQEMLLCPQAANLPITYHAADVLARLDDTFGDLTLLNVSEQAMVLNLLEFSRVIPSELAGLNENRIEKEEDADQLVVVNDSDGNGQIMRKASLQKIKHMEELTEQQLRDFKRVSNLRRSLLFLIFLIYVFCKFALISLHFATKTDEGVYQNALASVLRQDATLSRTTRIDNEVAQWISKASQAFGRLQASVWNPHGIHLNTELKMYEAVVLTTLPYGMETSTVYSSESRNLNHFQLSCLHRILKLRWQDRIPDTEVLDWTGIPSIHAMLRQMQLRWSGHLVRMDDERILKRHFYGDRYHQLIREECLGDRQSTELLRRMQTLRGELHIDDKLFKEMA
ncbi:unnamed protein product [Schistocephalus solidus]|uniref:Uncharacterized protein n=1 Tax=Schistocephalus solidus TaxID=70667 RepID=A0A183SJV9_SCHSO|nr:unnamed protein product [Schistocephalus solidus]